MVSRKLTHDQVRSIEFSEMEAKLADLYDVSPELYRQALEDLIAEQHYLDEGGELAELVAQEVRAKYHGDYARD